MANQINQIKREEYRTEDGSHIMQFGGLTAVDDFDNVVYEGETA